MIEYIFKRIARSKVRVMRLSSYTGLLTTPLLLYNTVLLRQFSITTSITIAVLCIIVTVIIMYVDDKYIYPRELEHIYSKIPQLNDIKNIVDEINNRGKRE